MEYGKCNMEHGGWNKGHGVLYGFGVFIQHMDLNYFLLLPLDFLLVVYGLLSKGQ